MSVSRVRTVVYLDLHAGDAPAAADRPDGSHPPAGELVELVGRDGPGVYEVERVDHDVTGPGHVVRVFVERADPFRACQTRASAPPLPCPRVAAAAGSGASDARLVV